MVSSEINKDLFLFYGVYDTKQLLINDLELIPCIFENKHPWKREFQIYKTIYNLVSKSQENENNIIGLFSASFIERTGLNYQSVCKLIKENDADIFIFSPCQYNSLIFYNYWDQAEICHEGIRKEVKEIFSLNKSFPTIDFQSRTPKDQFSFCNFWAAKSEYFIKIVKNMISLDDLMTENNLGLKETFHRSPFEYSFNKSYKKTYKLFPFIIERYLSSTLMDEGNKILPKVFYWNDNRSPIEQVEEIEDLRESLKGPISRAKYYESKKTIFENKRDFYEKVWLDEDFEKFDKVNSINGQMIDYLCDLI